MVAQSLAQTEGKNAMNEIPHDIKRASEMAYAARDTGRTVLFAIADAISSERRRCSDIAVEHKAFAAAAAMLSPIGQDTRTASEMAGLPPATCTASEAAQTE
jgi:hypothetical protein